MTWLALLTNRWLQLAAGTALALVLGFGLGHHQRTLEDASAALSETKRAVQTVAKQSAVTASVDQHTIQATAKTQATTNANLQKIPIYVTRASDDQCIIGRGAVSLLDASASGVPAPAVSLPDADSGVHLAELVSDAVVNAGNYHQLAERLKAWDAWYDAQAKIAQAPSASKLVVH